jgi:hypothetical protein
MTDRRMTTDEMNALANKISKMFIGMDTQDVLWILGAMASYGISRTSDPDTVLDNFIEYLRQSIDEDDGVDPCLN